MKSRKKAFVLIVIVAAIIAYFAFEQRKNKDVPLTDLVYYGNVEIRRVNLSFRVGGRIDEILVDEGISVRKGETFAKLDARPFEAEVASATASRDEAKATLERLENGPRTQEIEEARAQSEEYRADLALAETEFQRNANLIKNNAVSASDYDSAESTRNVAKARLDRSLAILSELEEGSRKEDIAAAKARLAQAEANLERAKIALEDTTLAAPNDGVILTRVAEQGAVVTAGQTVATLSVRDTVWVYIFIEESDLGRVVPGAKVEITTDSSSKTYRGHIGYVSPEAEFTPKTVESPNLRTNLVYRVRIVADSPDDGLRQGAPVTVRFLSEDVKTEKQAEVPQSESTEKGATK